MSNEFSETISDLVDANHILFNEQIVDGFGHVSARHPSRPDRMLISRSMAPALVNADDIVEVDLNGEPIEAAGPKLYLERFIHSEIYRKRPDVQAVVHSHSATLVQFGIVKGISLRPVCHMCGYLRETTPVFEIREVAGDGTDLLIRNSDLGRELATCLDSHAAVLMRGHGSTVVGGSIRHAVFRAVYLERNARIQAEAMKMGEIISLTPEEAKAADEANSGQIDRAWDLWRLASETRR
ncbi:class II aldolase/adducin family protein [Rhizobium sp. P38BS-XIX]|uniref:class II aldolase/adducin family protein n=1 Tax=Rhizobium sp. P38BS-XIX TaxID=2726740 RepID=UPI001456B3E1|nr:class II aldolase/adducin family protein [Rhizobium sp. P38BS-XIX]NLS01106.1 class II aldolase/adducin family protein [Rhizobium sp. P38BS-XIX]